MTRTRTATPPRGRESHRVGEPQRRDDLGDVVQPHDVGASVGAQHRGRERAPQVALVEPGRVRRELLVRARREQRGSERAQTRQRRDQRDVARGVLAEPEARVEQERVLRDPGREGLLPSRAQLGLDLVDRDGVAPRAVRARLAAVVRADEPGAAPRGDAGQLGIPEAGVVVDEHRAGGERGVGDLGAVGVDRDRHAECGDLLHDRPDPIDLERRAAPPPRAAPSGHRRR